VQLVDMERQWKLPGLLAVIMLCFNRLSFLARVKSLCRVEQHEI